MSADSRGHHGYSADLASIADLTGISYEKVRHRHWLAISIAPPSLIPKYL